MGILDNNNITPQIPNAEKVATRLKHQARATFNQMVKAFNDGSKTFWQNDKASPSEISAALGSDAKEIFELHGKLGELIASIKPESITEGSSVVGSFVINEDGTVTINN